MLTILVGKLVKPIAGTLVNGTFQLTVLDKATLGSLLHPLSRIPAKIPLLLRPNVMMDAKRGVGVSLIHIVSRAVTTDGAMCICVESRKAVFFDFGNIDYAFWISVVLAKPTSEQTRHLHQTA